MLTNLDCFTNAIRQVTRGSVAGKKRHFMIMYPWSEVYVIWIFGYRILPIAKIPPISIISKAQVIEVDIIITCNVWCRKIRNGYVKP